MKILQCGVAVVGVAAVLYVGLSVGAAVNGRSVMDLCELGKCVVEARASRHTVEERVAAIEAKKPLLKSVAESAGEKPAFLVSGAVQSNRGDSKIVFRSGRFRLL